MPAAVVCKQVLNYFLLVDVVEHQVQIDFLLRVVVDLGLLQGKGSKFGDDILQFLAIVLVGREVFLEFLVSGFEVDSGRVLSLEKILISEV